MGVLFNNVDRSDLRAGDHVYSWRAGYTYAHHGIYVGDNHVVHFTRGSDQDLGVGTSLINSFASSSIPKQHLSCTNPTGYCGFQNGNNGVIRSCLNCFLDGGYVRRFEYGVTKAVFFAQALRGTCTLAQSDPPGVVIHRAEYLLQNGFANYDVISMNCEDFAIYCKTGFIVGSHDSGSGQVGVLRAVMSAAGSCLTSKYAYRVIFAADPVGLTFWTVVNFAIGRYRGDIGVRDDKIKVPVEYLPVFLESSIGSKIPVADSSTSEAISRDKSFINGTVSLNSATPNS